VVTATPSPYRSTNKTTDAQDTPTLRPTRKERPKMNKTTTQCDLLPALYGAQINKTNKARKRVVHTSGIWSAIPLDIADDRFVVEHEPVVELELTTKDLARLEEDLAMLEQIRVFFHENPQERHNFEMWQTMDTLRQA
jgi:hypothetical protein